MTPEPLRGAELRAALAVICDPLRGIPPPTEQRLQAMYTPSMARRVNGRNANAQRIGKFCDHIRCNAAARRKGKIRGPKPKTLAAEHEMRAMWDAGRPIAEICARFDRAERTVMYALRASGVRLRVGQGMASLSREAFAARFAELGVERLAAELGQRVDGVRKRARRMGLLAVSENHPQQELPS